MRKFFPSFMGEVLGKWGSEMICTPKVGLNNQLIKVQIFMAKYTQSFKQQVIEFYLQNNRIRSLTRQHFQVKETILRY
ncbi:hypothetical protein B4U42_11680 [Glaesserella parasuis 29755]|nr:hypothetical protein B4U42_11680 [Glaesserella parasuis 29755]